ncbi:MAG: hypothetical protein MUF42_00470 [Cytophagaceae bacterium]|jgi:hypothetical protein|nr:hypothetical protein [Cytophagaceae bacterium]
MKTRLIYLLLVLFAGAAMAQDEMFRVLASKGSNKLQNTGVAEWKPLFVGKKLLKGDKITIGENGYIGLAHKSGKTIELRKAGTYEVAKLAGEVNTQNASAQKKYVDYLANEAKKNENNDMARDRYKYMQATGSVERPVGYLGLWALDKDTVVSGNIFLRWDKKHQGPFVIKVTNFFEDAIFEAETNESTFQLNLDSKIEKTYKVTVSEKGNPENKSEITVFFLDAFKAENVRKQAAELQSVLGGESALNKIVLASFYEDQRLYMDAMRLYEEALKLEPGVEDYQIAYGQFLSRTNFAIDAETAAKKQKEKESSGK